MLEAIKREGSISAAGRASGMSYRRTWLLVDTMNRCWAGRLVETTRGGGPERGARLTSLGKEVLATFRAIETCFAETAIGELATLAGRMRIEPLPFGD